jgi:hypothetical protein
MQILVIEKGNSCNRPSVSYTETLKKNVLMLYAALCPKTEFSLKQ